MDSRSISDLGADSPDDHGKNVQDIRPCTSGFIWGKHRVELYKGRATGEGPTFWERKGTRVSCEECGVTMAASSMRHHMERSHGKVLPQVMGVDVG